MNDKNTQRRHKRERVGERERERTASICMRCSHCFWGHTTNPSKPQTRFVWQTVLGGRRQGKALRGSGSCGASQVATVERRHVLILNGTALGNDRRPDRDTVEAYGIMMKPPPLVAVLPPPPPPAPPLPSPSPSPTATATAPSGVKPSSRSGRALLPIWVLGCRHI